MVDTTTKSMQVSTDIFQSLLQLNPIASPLAHTVAIDEKRNIQCDIEKLKPVITSFLYRLISCQGGDAHL